MPDGKPGTEDPANPTDPELPTPEPVPDAVGETGEVQWSYTAATGTLRVFGNGKMGDYTLTLEDISFRTVQPWYAYQDSILHVEVAEGVTYIGAYAFWECSSLRSVTLPDSVTSIGESAFGSCGSLSDITLPDSVTSIGESAFFGCGSLSSITLPENVTSIAGGAFDSCSSLRSVTIPASVTYIDELAFWNCRSLSGIAVADGNLFYCSDGGILFSLDKTRLVCYPACKTEASYTIPANVTDIGYAAFYGCRSLTDVYFGGTGSRWTELEQEGVGMFLGIPTPPTVHYDS